MPRGSSQAVCFPSRLTAKSCTCFIPASARSGFSVASSSTSAVPLWSNVTTSPRSGPAISRYTRRSTDETERTRSAFAGEIGLTVGFGTGAATARAGSRTATDSRRERVIADSSEGMSFSHPSQGRHKRHFHDTRVPTAGLWTL